jgi:hypothetical protein
VFREYGCVGSRACYIARAAELRGGDSQKMGWDDPKTWTGYIWFMMLINDRSWPIGAISTPGFGRKGLVHNVINFADTPLNIHGFDDEVCLTTFSAQSLYLGRKGYVTH